MINKEKLEELLVRNWTKFLDTKKIMVKTLQDVNISTDKFNYCKDEKQPANNTTTQIGLSRFCLTESGFIIWIEFVVPNYNYISVGTIEYIIYHNGSIELKQIMGTKFTKPI